MQWYIVQSYSGFEKKVSEQIEEELKTANLSDHFDQVLVPTQDVTGEVTLPAGTEMIMPGDDAKMTVTLISPIAMDENLKFAIREGGRTVGAGVVTKVIE